MISFASRSLGREFYLRDSRSNERMAILQQIATTANNLALC